MNTPTPRTDAEIEGWVSGLQHMADDHLCCRATVLDTIELIKELKIERDQLRKMLDAFAECGDVGDEWLMADYRELPHVRARKTK
jgi:hypothetical protein